MTSIRMHDVAGQQAAVRAGMSATASKCGTHPKAVLCTCHPPDDAAGKDDRRHLAPAGAEEDEPGKGSDRSPAAPSITVGTGPPHKSSKHEGALRGSQAAHDSAVEEQAPSGPGARGDEAGADHVSHARVLVDPAGLTALPGAITSQDERVRGDKGGEWRK